MFNRHVNEHCPHSSALCYFTRKRSNQNTPRNQGGYTARATEVECSYFVLTLTDQQPEVMTEVKTSVGSDSDHVVTDVKPPTETAENDDGNSSDPEIT